MQEFFQTYGSDIVTATREHLQLTLLAMLIACAVAIPLGILLTRIRSKTTVQVILGLVSVIQPIPSLALVALVAVGFYYLNLALPYKLPTIGVLPGMVALVAYAVLPILRNTYTGIQQVDDTVKEVATGMGMTRRQILFQVELPLALPVIMTGIRIATVWTVGVATLVALVDAGGLGALIFRGLSNYKVKLILAGAIPAVAMALVFDGGLYLIENWLTPQGLKTSEST